MSAVDGVGAGGVADTGVAKTSLTRAMNASAGTAESSHPDGLGWATASWAASDSDAAAISRNSGYPIEAPARRRRRMVRNAATGTSSR